MMKRVITILFLATFAMCSLTGLVISLAADDAIATAADVAGRPKSAADLIMDSRTTAPADRSSAGWIGAALVAVTVVGLGGAYVAMRGGSDFLRQWRLLKKSNNRQQGQRPYLPPMQQPIYDELPTMPGVRRVRELPAWSETDESQYR